MKNIIPIVGASLFILIIASLFLHQQSQIASLRRQLTSPAEISPSPIPTSSWQTYKNDQYGFEFRYPQNFLINEDQESIEIFSKPCSCETDQNGKTEKISVSSVKISIKSHIGKSFNDIWKKAFGFDFSLKNYDIVNSIGDKKAFCFYSGAESATGTESCLVETSPTSALEINTYTPVLVYRCEECQRQNNPGNITSAQILSTFKFTNSSPPALISTPKYKSLGWQVYVNNIYNFQFEYPSDYQLNDQLKKSFSEENLPIVLNNETNGTSITVYINPYDSGPFFTNKYVEIQYDSKTMSVKAVSEKTYKPEDLLVGRSADARNEYSIVTSFTRLTDKILFGLYVKNPKGENLDKLFSQILSTFKFTN